MKDIREPVLILHHAVPAGKGTAGGESDAGVMDEVHAVARAMEEIGIWYRTAAVRDLTDVAVTLQNCQERLVFNLVETLQPNPADAMLVPSLCDAFRKLCTGNDSVAQTTSQDKWRTKVILSAVGQPVPAGAVVNPGESLDASILPPPPYIVKPLWADASEGIDARSYVRTKGKPLNKAIARVHKSFRQPALVEQYVGHREINAAILQRGRKVQVLPLSEIQFRRFGLNRPRIVDYAAKWHPGSFQYRNTVRFVPANLQPSVARRIRRSALAAWEALRCRDYARVDFRLDAQGNIFILEVNPNPDISPQSGFAAALKAANIPYSEFVRSLCVNALKRVDAPGRLPRRPARLHNLRNERVALRWSEKGDRDIILQFVKETAFFHVGELSVAAEVLDEAIEEGPSGNYQSYTLTHGKAPIGWVCFGRAPCTQGTFDVYWIAVAPRWQGRGYGKFLLSRAEELIRSQGGRLILAETSGRPLYNSTRHFYLTAGYHEVSRVPEFYAPNDDRVVYSKHLRNV